MPSPAELTPVPMISLEERSEAPGHDCGVLAYLSPKPDLDFYGITDTAQEIQNRGHEAYGAVVFNEETKQFEGHKDAGTITEVTEAISGTKALKLVSTLGRIGMAHTQWSTYRKAANAQPYSQKQFAGAHNGNAENALLLALDRNIPISECPTDSIAINKVVEKDAQKLGGLLPALKNLQTELEGAFAYVSSDGESVFGMKDDYGLKPLAIGLKPDGTYIFASETVALDKESAVFIREVEQGEIVEFRDDGNGPEMFSHPTNPEVEEEFCALEIGYFIRPNSIFRGKPAEWWRHKLGEKLAEEVLAKNPDLDPSKCVVIGVPESGLPSAAGFAEGAEIMNADDVLEKVQNKRSYTAATKEEQEKIAREKLSIDEKALFDAIIDKETGEYKTIFLNDDSVVKGNQIGRLVERLVVMGVPRESIHVMIAFPEIVDECHLGSSIEKEKLLSYERNYEEKCQKLGVASLTNISLEGFREVIPRTCGGCFGDKYPVAPLKLGENANLLDMLATASS